MNKFIVKTIDFKSEDASIQLVTSLKETGFAVVRNHGINKELTGKYYWSNVLGYNYNWTNLQAALALAQLRRIDELIKYKKWWQGAGC